MSSGLQPIHVFAALANTWRANVHNGAFALTAPDKTETSVRALTVDIGAVEVVDNAAHEKAKVRLYCAVVGKAESKPCVITLTGVACWRFLAVLRETCRGRTVGGRMALRVRIATVADTVDTEKHGHQNTTAVHADTVEIVPMSAAVEYALSTYGAR